MDKAKILTFIQRRICNALLDYEVSNTGRTVLLFSRGFTEQEQDKVYNAMRYMNLGVRWLSRSTTYADIFDQERKQMQTHKDLQAKLAQVTEEK